MFSNPAIPHPAIGPHPFTLNDLRVRSYATEEKSSNSGLAVSGMVLVAVLAIGAFVVLDPLALFAPAEPKATAPAPAFVPSTEPGKPAAMKEIIAPQPLVPATKSIVEPAVAPTVVQTPSMQAPAARQRASSTTPESRSNPRDKADSTALRTSPKARPTPPAVLTSPQETAPPPVRLIKPEETAASPALLIKPEEKPDVPLVPSRGDDIKDAPKPAATSDQPPGKDEAN